MSGLRIGLAALIAFVVSVICLIPPGIHFVTGPIGPFIGGYVVGNRFRLGAEEAMIVGLVMGVALGGTAILAFEYTDFLPNLALAAVIPLSVVAALYVGVLGGLGAWLAGGREPSEESSQESND